jgi:hypothetical protein
LALTLDKVKNSPSIDTDKPVSRQHERDYHGYYGYPYYWGYLASWGMGAYPSLLATSERQEAPTDHSKKPSSDVHLRSIKEILRYNIHGNDQTIGHLDDLVVDDQSWEVRYLVVDTAKWWVGKKVLVAPSWTSRVSWAERTIHVNLSGQTIKDSPEWDATAAVNREYETRLYDYYGRPAYWSGADRPAATPPPHHL